MVPLLEAPAMVSKRNYTSSIRSDVSADEQLHALQCLAAHVKLLIDASEHLWRFLERRRYLHAAWLFLLCRVVHRSLVRADEDNTKSWMSQGVNVMVR